MDHSSSVAASCLRCCQAAFKVSDPPGAPRVAVNIICPLFPAGNLYFFYALLSKRSSEGNLSLVISLGVYVRSRFALCLHYENVLLGH